MPLTIDLVPGYTFTVNEQLTTDKLNSLGNPTISLEGSISSVSIADGSVTTAKLANGVLSADATGLGKMANGYFTADATGRAKLAAGFFGVDTTSPALFADGFFANYAPVIGTVRNLVAQPTQLTPITLGGGELTSSTTTATVTHTAHGFVVGQSVQVSGAVPAAYNGTYVIASVADANHFTYTFAGGTSPATGTITVAAFWNSRVTLTADEMLLKSTLSNPFLATSVSLTLDITASGANGLDTGAEASSTWYYLWAIYNPTTVTVAGLISLSATAPTLPSGYTYKALAGAVRNDGSSNFVAFYQQDRMVWLDLTNLFTAKGAGTANIYESYQAGGGGADVDLRTVVPPIAKRLRGSAGSSNTSANLNITISADANGLGACPMPQTANSSTLDGFSSAVTFEVPLKTAQMFYWKSDGTSARARVSVSAYQI